MLPQALMWDGATLRFARRTPDGVQLVLWTLQDRRWQRWASAPTTHMTDLTDAWMRSQQWGAISGNAVTVLKDVDSFNFILCNPNGLQVVGCSWNNAGSSQGTVASGNAYVAPLGLRITLKLPDGDLVRERELPRWAT